MLTRALEWLDHQRNQMSVGLMDFLRFASISSDASCAGEMDACANWLADRLRECGLSVGVEPTGGPPIVLARNHFVPGRPTVLLYGHYDVQPVDPLSEWTTHPFEPAIRNGAVYARGATDDKGQLWAHVQALRAWHEVGGVGINLIVLIEGEEEIDSHHLEAFMVKNKQALRADIAVISDMSQYARGAPAITCGLRGLVYSQVNLKCAARDLHSGIYGGAVPNAANTLCNILATLHDGQGRVNIPSFYDDVEPLAKAERDAWASLAFDEKRWIADLGVASATGEVGWTTLERRWARPTCDINGLTSGYQGEGAKTVIPATASAKVSMRLVPGQDPVKIQSAFERAVRERSPHGVSVEFEHFAATPAIRVPVDSPAMYAARRAVETGFGTPPVFIRDGLTIPVVGLFKRLLDIDTLLVGFGFSDDGAHAPNEKFELDALYHGARTAAALYGELAGLL